MENYREAKKGGLICSKCNDCIEKKPRKEYNRTKPKKSDDKNNIKCNRCQCYKIRTEFYKKDNINIYKTCCRCRLNILNKYHLNKKMI